jgi:hypothetical protein
MTTRRSLAWLLSPVGLLLISAGRLIIVSDYNTTTAVTIASSGGFLNTLLGSVIPLVPVFMPYLALLLLLFRRFLLSILAFAFAIFITPAPISLAATLNLAKEDWNVLVAEVSSERLAVIVIILIVVSLLWLYNRSFAEALSAIVVIVVAIVLMYSAPGVPPTSPFQLSVASAREHELTGRFTSAVSPDRLIMVTFALAVVFTLVFLTYRFVLQYNGDAPPTGAVVTLGPLLSIAAAVIATIALFPYVYNIYPIPQRSSYYAEVAHQMWLPAEELALTSGQIDTGYVLATDSDWFTVLLAARRTIVYLPTRDILTRSVCQPKLTNEPRQYPPLDRQLYNPPPRIPTCARDTSTPIASILSRGEPLSAISSVTHVHPWRIISITNAHEHERLPAALRAYERVHDWTAPTPIGQRFWYYCPSTLRQACVLP